MAKTKISEFSATPGNNTDIDGINIAEGCAPSGINDAIRELMSQLKDFQAGTAGDSFNGPVGTTTAAAGAFTTLSASSTVTLSGGTANGVAYLNGSKVLTTGSGLVFDGTNLGLGVTPSAWATAKAMQIGNRASLFSYNNSTTDVGNNAYFNGSDYKYIETATATFYRQASGAHQWYTAPSGTAGNTITFTQAMTLDASGNLLVGTTTADPYSIGTYKRITLSDNASSSSYGIVTVAGGSGGGGEVDFGNQTIRHAAIASVSGSALAFYTNGTNSGSTVTERARIDSSGNLLVGTTNASGTAGVGAKVIVASGGNVFAQVTDQTTNGAHTSFNYYSTGAAAYRFYVGAGGTIYATSTTITAISDQRLKENIQDLDVGLDKIMALKPRKFDWKPGKGKDKKGDRGWIAQEFEQVFPDMIDEWRDPAPEGEEPYKAVNADLIPVLVKAIQELNAKVEAQAAEIAALKGN